MKSGITYVAREKFIAIARKLGLSINEQRGWVRIEGKDSNRRVYVARRKGVGVVTISGFLHPLGEEIPEDKRPTGRVHQQIDFSQPETDILRSFFRVLKDGLVDNKGESIDRALPGRANPPSEQEIEDAVAAAIGDELEP